MLRVMGKPVGKTPWLSTPAIKATKFCVFAYEFFCEQVALAEREVFRISIPVFVACDKGVCNLSW